MPAPRAGPRRTRRSPPLRAVVARALREDRVDRDRTTRALLPTRLSVHARVVSQAKGILSGVLVAREVARLSGVRLHAIRVDGQSVRPGMTVLELDGDARKILALERTLLNFLMHLSGIATATARAVAAVGPGRNRPKIYATRKTTPGLRALEKAAVVHGGGWPHRRSLAEAILIKNNHLELVALPLAIENARRHDRTPIEVEVRSNREAVLAARLGAERLLIDNAPPARARAIVRSLERAHLRNGRWIELSGGITPQNAGRYRATGADALSLGALTHSAPALPFHLRVTRR